MKYLSLRS